MLIVFYCRSTAKFTVGLQHRIGRTAIPGVTGVSRTAADVPASALAPPGRARERQPPRMSIAKKVAHKAEAVKGGAKETAGQATDSPRLEAEGRGDQAKGDLSWPGPRSRTPSSTDHPGPPSCLARVSVRHPGSPLQDLQITRGVTHVYQLRS